MREIFNIYRDINTIITKSFNKEMMLSKIVEKLNSSTPINEAWIANLDRDHSIQNIYTHTPSNVKREKIEEIVEIAKNRFLKFYPNSPIAQTFDDKTYGKIVLLNLIHGGKLFGILGIKFEDGFEICKDDEILKESAKSISYALYNLSLESRIKEHENVMKNILESSISGYWDWSLEKNKEFLSPSLKKMLGYGRDESLSMFIGTNSVFDKEHRANLEQRIISSLKYKNSFDEEVSLKRKSGSNIEVIISGQVIERDMQRSPKRVVGFIIDITKQKEAKRVIERTNQKIKASRDKYQALFDGINDAIYVHPLVPYGFKEFIEVNEGACRMLGYSRDELLKMSANDITSMDDIKKYGIKRARARLLHDKWVIFEAVHIRKDGTPLSVEIHSKVFDIDGEPVIMSIVRDITEKKQSEKAIKEHQKKLEKTQKIAKIGWWEQDLVENSAIWSDEIYTIFELDRERTAIDTDTFRRYIIEEDRLNPEIALKNSLEKNLPFKLTYRIKTKNGKIKYIYEEADIERDKDGRAIKLFGYALDITDKKMMQLKLNEKEELMIAQSRHAAMGEMISMIAHQWRQPISVIGMAANNLIMDHELGVFDEESLVRECECILDQTKYLSKTIDDFRDFFKPDKSTEVVSIEKIFDDTMRVIGKSIENSNISVDIDIPKNIKAQTYSRELMQVLINILKNAKEIIIERGVTKKQISAKVENYKDKLKIVICDSGGGIGSKNIKMIFEPYYTTKDEQNGTGLGLYMCKTIIEKHLKGEIVAFDGDEGACFEILIPKSTQTSKAS